MLIFELVFCKGVLSAVSEEGTGAALALRVGACHVAPSWAVYRYILPYVLFLGGTYIYCEVVIKRCIRSYV